MSKRNSALCLVMGAMCMLLSGRFLDARRPTPPRRPVSTARAVSPSPPPAHPSPVSGTAQDEPGAKGPGLEHAERQRSLPIVGECPRALPAEGETDESGAIEKRGAWEWQRLTYPTGEMPEGDWRGEALRYVEDNFLEQAPEGLTTFPSGREEAVIAPGTTWTAMGPMPLDSNGTSSGYKYGTVTGRVNAVAFANATTAYVGGPVGGLWKTTNFSPFSPGSTTWTPLWDDPNFAAQSVGAIAVDPNNPDVVYVGTGDSQPVAGDMYGNGIFKSTDGGATWTQYGAALFSPYQSPGAPGTSCCAQAPDENIKAIAIDPRNSNTVVVGAAYGLFISYDAGVTWTPCDIVNRTVAPWNVSAQRVTSILIDGNTNPSTLWVAVGYPYSSSKRPNLIGGANGVYKGTVPSSGTPTLTLMNNGWPSGTGNGTTTAGIGRIELAWDATHTHVYAYAASYATSATPVGLFHTSDGGTNWNNLIATNPFTGCGGDSTQDWYNLYLAVDPLNDKTIYVGRTNLWKGTVSSGYTSMTAQSLSGVYSSVSCGYGTIHPDQHGFAFVPGSNPSTFICTNDGGVYFGTGSVGGFTQLNRTLNTMEFYAGQLGRDFANTGGSTTQYAFGGFQDNGSASWDSSNSSVQWQARSVGGDGFFASFDPLAGTLTGGRWVTEYSNGALNCSGSGAKGSFTGCAPSYPGGDRKDWSTPFLLDQWNCTSATCGNMVLGSTFVWASTGAGGSWTKTGSADLTKGSGDIISIDVSHNTPGSVIAGTNDGNVQWSSNVFTGANCTAAAANTSSFSCTSNSAATWVDLTGGNAVLPNRVINGVAFDPTTNLTFYAAVGGFDTNTPSTPGHIFQGTCSDGTCSSFTWTDKTGALPDIPFTAVAVNPNNPNQVFVGSYLGFFNTNDISADPVVWNRFQTGMPNTRINYLAVDRGVTATPRASTTLGAFTYGRGLYVTQVGAAPSCPQAPTVGTATTPADGQVQISWTPGSPTGITYNVYRAAGACPASGFTLLASGLAASPYTDTGLPGQATYAYKVTTVDATGTCESTPSGCASATTTGPCSTAPTFGGISSVTVPFDANCTLQLAWSAGSPGCSGASVSYNVYRSTSSGFTPSASNRIATGVTGTSFTDVDGVASGTTYYYVVRAVDSMSLAEDANLVSRSGAPVGPLTYGTWSDDGGDTGTSKLLLQSPWSVAATGGHNGPRVYQTGTYANNQCVSLTTPSLIVGTGGGTLTFWSKYDIETGWDKGQVEVSTDGGTSWSRLAVTSYPAPSSYTGDACGFPAGQTYFTGTNTTWGSFTATLPAGSAVAVRWRLSSDVSVTKTGWWIDDIAIANVGFPGTCSTSVALGAVKPVPDGLWIAGTPDNASKTAPDGSSVSLTWDTSTCADAGYNLYYGKGSQVGTYTLSGSLCGMGNSGSYAWSSAPSVPAGETFIWWVIVGTDGVQVESSWGRDSSGNERHPAASGQCGFTAKSTAATCP